MKEDEDWTRVIPDPDLLILQVKRALNSVVRVSKVLGSNPRGCAIWEVLGIPKDMLAETRS